MNTYVITVGGCLFLLTLVTRALPFFFGSVLENDTVKAIGKHLTAYILMILVLYEVNPASFKTYPYGWPALASLSLVVGIHLLLHKPFLSMVVGTTCFILLNQYVI